MNLGVVLTLLALAVGAAPQEKNGRSEREDLGERRKHLQQEHREIAGDIAAVEYEMSREPSAESARKLAELRVRKEEILDELDRVRSRIDQMEFDRAAGAAQDAEKQRELVARETELAQMYDRLARTEKTYEQLRMEHSAAEALQQAHLRQIEDLTRRLADREDRLVALQGRVIDSEADPGTRPAGDGEVTPEGDPLLHEILRRLDGNEERMLRMQERLEVELAQRDQMMNLADRRSQDAISLYRRIAERLERVDPYGLTAPAAPGAGASAGSDQPPRPSVAVKIDPRVQREMLELRLADAELEKQSQALGEEARAAGSGEAGEEIRARLRAVLERQFLVRLEIREMEIHGLEQRIADLREEFELRADQKDRLIDRRVEDLTGSSKSPW